MDTLAEAIERLEREGYTESFQVEAPGIRATKDGRLLEPRELVTREVVRFEGTSNPDDESILFALETRDGSLRGTLSTSFGPRSDPEAVEVIRALPEPAKRG